MYGLERYLFVVWWVFSIDTHSVLTGSGRGEFVETMLNGDVLSSLRVPGSTVDRHARPSVLEFHRTILILAARLGLLARDLRQVVTQSYGRQAQMSHAERMHRRQRVEKLRDSLRSVWNTQAPEYVAMGCSNEHVPVHARGIFEHVSPFHAASIPDFSTSE